MHAVVARDAGEDAFPRPPVVLVHGLGVSHRYLLPLAGRLAGEFQVAVPDLPGFGRSQKPRRVLTIGELAGALEGWMDAVQLDSATLVGNSMGCQVIAELAAVRPERVDRAVLIGPAMDPRASTPAAQIRLLVRDAVREPLSVLGIAVADYVRCGPRRMWQTFRYALEHDMAGRLQQMRCPTLVVRGEHDALASAEWVQTAVRLLSDGRLSVVPDAAHAAHYSAPGAVARIVREFVTRSKQRSAGMVRAENGSGVRPQYTG
jgi:pimeloyl-ACP methyl ester carboxylesterase